METFEMSTDERTQNEIIAVLALLELSAKLRIFRDQCPSSPDDEPIDYYPVPKKARGRGRPPKKLAWRTSPRAVKESPKLFLPRPASADCQYVAAYCISPVTSKRVKRTSALHDKPQFISPGDENGFGDRTQRCSPSAYVDEDVICAAGICMELRGNWIKSIIC